jgi:hypothetical protein
MNTITTAKEAFAHIAPCYTGENSFSRTLPLAVGEELRDLLLAQGYTRKVCGTTVRYKHGRDEFSMSQDGEEIKVYTYRPGYSCD